MNSKKRLLRKQKLYLIVDITSRSRPSIAKLKPLIKEAADIVQLRGKEISDKLFLDYAIGFNKICKEHKITFIVNDRPDIALYAGADGVHLGQDDIAPSAARKILGKDKIVGLSTHSISQIKKSENIKEIDYIGIGPIFKTGTKPKAKPLGLGIIKKISKTRKNLLYFAIGGIDTYNIHRLLEAGARRIAVISCVFNSKNPLTTAKTLKKILYDTD